MNDYRALVNGRNHLSVFITGHQYVTVCHRDVTLADIIEEMQNFVEGGLKKPFVVVSQTILPTEDFRFLVDNELVDIVME